MRKRILALALMLVMCLSLLPTGALAKDLPTSGRLNDYITWKVNTKTDQLTISGTGDMPDYKNWTTETESPFRGFTRFKSIVIESGITSIGSVVFYECSGVTSVTIPDTVTRIGSYAFSGCTSLTDVTIPASVTSIEKGAFQNCSSLPGAVIPNGVTSIEEKTFSGCSSLESITIPDSVTAIGTEAFSDCDSLTSVAIPAGVTSIADKTFSGCSKLESITIPDGVTSIGEEAFKSCYKLQSISLPDGISSIGKRAFYSCSALTSFTIPASLTSIEEETFQWCQHLERIEIPDHVTSIGKGAFQACHGLKNVTLPDTITSLEENTFYACTSLEDITIPESVTVINSDVFAYCTKLQEIEIPDSVTSMGVEVFQECTGLKSAVLPEGLPFLSGDMFRGCTSLERITIPNGAASIIWNCFKDCTSLTSIQIPNSIIYIEYSAFENCTALTDVYYHGTQAEWDAISVSQTNEPLKAAALHLEDHDYAMWSETKAPACVEPGEESSTCTICGRVETREIPALGHVPDGDGVVTKPSCTEQGYTTYTCARCGETYQDDFVDATGHDYGEWTVTIEPSCLWSGEKERVCANDPSHVETRTVYALGHDWSDWEITKPATEESTGLKVSTCARCGETKTEVIPQIEHVHDYKAVVTKPTCTQQGYTTHTCRCGDSYTDNYVNPLGHDYKKSSKDATCTAAGHTEQEICSRCGDVRKQGETIPALGHKTEFRNKKDATCTADGYTGDEVCTRCGKTIHKGEKIAAKGHQWSAWSVVKAATVNEGGVEKRTCSVCGESETRNTKSKSALNPFTDVKDGAYYYDAVIWAVTHDPQITDGTSDTTFSPDATCTRGQVVTFLWRAKGCPEPNGSENRFSDVRSGDYFYKAVLWAIEQCVTDGTSDTTFSPNDPCTRGHVVTFLWRSEGCPSAKGGDAFNDVPGDAYYSDAVRWAVSRGITDGTSATTFSPNEACTRGQIVTFLYRDITGARGELAPPTISEEEGIRYCQQVFRSIKRDYSKAVAIMGYYARYRDSEGNIATYVEITYRIGNNTRQWKDTVLYVDGDVIHDPIDYYDKMADRAYGAASLHYMQLSIDVTRAAAKQYPGGIVTRDQF